MAPPPTTPQPPGPAPHHAPSSLPPRPPPSQVAYARRPVTPALPISTMNGKSRKQYTPQGIGRGHASLPPKPFVPGKPLPRDTEAVVLTPGGDGPHFSSTPSKPKRPYTTVANEAQMRPMDPAVTNLTPENHLTPQNRAVRHSPVMPKTITPPAEQTMPPKMAPYNQAHGGHGNGHAHGHGPGHGDAGYAAGNGQKVFRPNSNGTPENMLQPAGPDQQLPHHHQPQPQQPQPPHRPDFSRPDFRGHPQDFNGYPPASGVYGHEMYPPPHMNAGIPGMGPVPHPTHMQGQLHGGPAFIHSSYNGTLTPPHTGTMFLPPPLPLVDGFMEQHMGPGPYGGFIPAAAAADQHPPPHLPPQAFSPPPGANNAGHFGPPPERPSSRPAVTPVVTRPGGNLSITAKNPKLLRISFIVDDNEESALEEPPNANGQTEGQQDGAANALAQDAAFVVPPQSIHVPSTSSYAANRFLSQKLADISLVLANGKDDQKAAFPAHSFVLGQSPKLAQLIEDAWNYEASCKLTRGRSSSSWADEMEEPRAESPLNPTTVTSSCSIQERLTTITFPIRSKTLTQTTFLLVLKTLYVGGHHELDAYLDPTHPEHRRVTLEISPATQPSKEPAEHDDSSQDIKMLERAIEVFIAGCLLGLDLVIHRAVSAMRTWGFRFGNGAFERLLKFLLEEAPPLQNDPSMSSSHKGSEGMSQRLPFHFLQEAIAFFVASIPAGFRPDLRAPNSRYLMRLPSASDSAQTEAESATPTTAKNPERTAYSTVFFSLPFEVLKQVLEHPQLAVTKKQRFDLSSQVTQERERRRKREAKALQERAGVAGTDQLDGLIRQMEGLGLGVAEETVELLFWEESAVTTFGLGDIGVELVKRRKGSPGGRLLWKVGRTAEPGR